MTIYLDSDYKCHLTQEDGYTATETDFFDGKCQTYIEGFRFIPEGAQWIRSDGVIFRGESSTPWRDYAVLKTAQKEYEQQKEIKLLTAKLEAAIESNSMLEDCLVEMAEIIYA